MIVLLGAGKVYCKQEQQLKEQTQITICVSEESKRRAQHNLILLTKYNNTLAATAIESNEEKVAIPVTQEIL